MIPGAAALNEVRVQEIRKRLESLEPLALEVIDESAAHRGHEGARDGRGHFRVRIRSAKFDGIRPLVRHRLVYEALGTLMQTDIHALAIEACGANEEST